MYGWELSKLVIALHYLECNCSRQGLLIRGRVSSRQFFKHFFGRQVCQNWINLLFLIFEAWVSLWLYLDYWSKEPEISSGLAACKFDFVPGCLIHTKDSAPKLNSARSTNICSEGVKRSVMNWATLFLRSLFQNDWFWGTPGRRRLWSTWDLFMWTEL